ncbi:hypothetical protein ABPG72_010423 [Tetrahymena utriculariae]
MKLSKKDESSSDPSDEDNKVERNRYWRFWQSQFEETVKEIQLSMIKKNRPTIKMQFIKKRREFGQPCKLNETDASEKMLEVKQQSDPFAHVRNKVIDIGLQGCNPIVNSSTQTIWNRRINKALTVDNDQTIVEIEDDNQELLKFLDNVYPLMEEALQSNETIDIYQNDFELFDADDVAAEGTELSNAIKEWKTFYYLQCKGKKISCIQFQPNNQLNQKGKYIAAAFMENLTFEERVIYSMKSHKFMIVFWDYDDQHSIDPVLILTSPLEIITFQFNPKDPNIVIGGAANGQIIMWDLKQSNSLYTVTGKKGQKAKQDSKSEIPEINPLILSQLQDPSSAQQLPNNEIVRKNVCSHKNPVLSISWIPPTVEFDRKVFNNVVHPTHGDCYQFASISWDGQVCFWDTRFNDQKDSKKQFDITSHQWKANYGLQLVRPEGGGTMGGSQIAFRKGQRTPTFTGTSDEGELFLVDWTVHPTEDSNRNDKVTKLWQNERSYRPTVTLECSPFYEDIILTIHDFNFCIWKHDVDVPIFDSAIVKQGQITCGAFSPSRPGVVIIGLNDGNINVWDFLDQSHKATLTYHVGAKPLSYIKFHENQHHSLAVGDFDGTVHILELPYTLWKKIGEEEKTMNDFWNREVLRVRYFKHRFEIREEEFKKLKEKKDQEVAEEAITTQKVESNVDEDEELEKEYQEQALQYINEVIKGVKPEQEAPQNSKAAKK